VIRIDGEKLHDHLRYAMGGGGNAQCESVAVVQARWYERERGATRRGDTRAGGFEVPNLRLCRVRTAIIDPLAESLVKEALIEISSGRVSVRRVEEITAATMGTRVSTATVSNLKRDALAAG
jgi:transposase-like protein